MLGLFISRKTNMDSTCVSCQSSTKYRCIKCTIPVCNKTLNCSIPVSEDFPGWKMCQQVSLCNECDSKIFKNTEKPEGKSESDGKGESDGKSESDREFFKILCASRGYHVYREIWRPKTDQSLIILPEKNNLHDPYSMGFFTRIPGKITNKTLVGHIPREISRFCLYFTKYGGVLSATVRETKFRRSPLPQGGLEIPITLYIRKAESTDNIYNQMKGFVEKYYMEPEKITIKEEFQEVDDTFDL